MRKRHSENLEIPYQVVLLSSGDMGFSAEKTYDIEMDTIEKKYENIGCSSCGTFQLEGYAKYKSDKGNF